MATLKPLHLSLSFHNTFRRTIRYQADHLSYHKHPPNDCIIFLDSLSVLYSIKNRRSKHSHLITQEIIKCFSTFQANSIILRVCWILSYTQIERNELTDTTAKQTFQLDRISNISVPLTNVKLHFKSLLQKKFQHKHWKTVKQPSRRFISILTRLRTGHTLLIYQHPS